MFLISRIKKQSSLTRKFIITSLLRHKTKFDFPFVLFFKINEWFFSHLYTADGPAKIDQLPNHTPCFNSKTHTLENSLQFRIHHSLVHWCWNFKIKLDYSARQVSNYTEHEMYWMVRSGRLSTVWAPQVRYRSH